MSTAKYAAKLVTVLALAGAALAAAQTRKDLHFKVGKHPMISISNSYGPVVVKAGATHEVIVTAILHSDRVEIEQNQNRSRIDIVSHLLPGADQNSGIVEFQLTVPPQSSLSIHAENGPVHAEKIHGDLTLEGSNGSMEVLDCGDGHVHVRTLNGPVSISNVRNGHVEVVSVSGDVALNSVSGPFVTVNSNTGKIQYAGDFSGEGEYDFTSHTGDIEAIAPAYASIDVTARSNQGRVESDFSLEPRRSPFTSNIGSAFHGTLNKAASSVRLLSFSGRIHLKKRQ